MLKNGGGYPALVFSNLMVCAWFAKSIFRGPLAPPLIVSHCKGSDSLLLVCFLKMDDAWNELSFDFEPAVQAALPPTSLGNTRDRFRTQVKFYTGSSVARTSRSLGRKLATLFYAFTRKMYLLHRW